MSSRDNRSPNDGRAYAVVTRVTPVYEGGRILVHTYGPYTLREAQRTQREIKAQARKEKWANRLECSLCTLLLSEDREPTR